MFEPKNNKILLPVQQAEYAYYHGLVKGLAIYLYLKFYTDGKIKSDSPILSQLRHDLRLKDSRTFKTHITALIEHNWIGYDPFSGMYFIRNTKFIRTLHEFRHRQATVVLPQDLKQFQIYLAAVLICKEVTDQEFYWDVVKKRRLRKATAKWAVAKHSGASSHSSNERPKYFGLCNKSIAAILHCKQTRACVIKTKAADLGYLQVKHKYKDVLEFAKPDFNIRSYLHEQYPNTAGRIRCWVKWKNNQKYYKLLLQLHDEIISQIKFKRIEKLSAIHLPIEVIRGINKAALKAA
ncbi:hypothetical protein DC498_03510 [Terrimonas sp.]|uniref:hypothetical protein n=1 Tax=Terrimonas sp. TaxID=1914338 RepID=UPI000D50CB8F|nr:hypothetical protein [Terrimonas sp.]PVD53598.1 hypothetical protein DC498_03510 [Terrimonas sp.]